MCIKPWCLNLKRKTDYYSAQKISKFKDSKDVPILGQYEQEDLEQFLDEKN